VIRGRVLGRQWPADCLIGVVPRRLPGRRDASGGGAVDIEAASLAAGSEPRL